MKKSNTPMGCKDLKKKWHKETTDSIKRLKLPTPDHGHGFSTALLQNNLPPTEFKKLLGWMCGQTCMLDEKLGHIYYTYDVIRGIDFIRHKTPTYFD